jgi:hypothetical protein
MATPTRHLKERIRGLTPPGSPGLFKRAAIDGFVVLLIGMKNVCSPFAKRSFEEGVPKRELGNEIQFGCKPRVD